MNQLSIPKSFFEKERDHLYCDWQPAFFREMFQNLLDAKATRADVNVFDVDGDAIVEVIDNGTGMTAATINDVFFALGATTKDSEDGVGGFGRARILTCFSAKSYEFWTHDHYCHGDGAMYAIEEVPDYYDGCKFRINLGKANVKDLLISLRKVLRHSQLDCKVFVNGEKFTEWTYKRRLIKSESFGNIHVNKSGYSDGYINVRVKGLWTFSIYTSAKPQIVIEIDPKVCRKVLTVNRDGMHWDYKNQLDMFVQELAIDKRSALRDNRRKTRLIEGEGVKISYFEDCSATVADNLKRNGLEFVMQSMSASASIGVGGSASALSSLNTVERKTVGKSSRIMDFPTIYISDQTDHLDHGHRKVRKVIDQYDPKNWTIFRKKRTANNDGTETFRKGGTKLKLLMVWEACCAEAVDVFMRVHNIPEVRWMTGWTFDLEATACHESLMEGHALCLNPVNEDGTMAYKIRSKTDQRILMALAKHEVAHVACKYHDEDFSSLHTMIDASFDEAACFRRIKNVLKSA